MTKMHDPAYELRAFNDMLELDKVFLKSLAWKQSWSHLQERLAEGASRIWNSMGF